MFSLIKTTADLVPFQNQFVSLSVGEEVRNADSSDQMVCSGIFFDRHPLGKLPAKGSPTVGYLAYHNEQYLFYANGGLDSVIIFDQHDLLSKYLRLATSSEYQDGEIISQRAQQALQERPATLCLGT